MIKAVKHWRNVVQWKKAAYRPQSYLLSLIVVKAAQQTQSWVTAYTVFVCNCNAYYLIWSLLTRSPHIETNRSSSSVTLSRPSSSSSPKITDRSFRYASPCLWNKLPASFRQPNPDHSFSHSSQPNCLSSSVPSSPLSLSITPSLFHCKLKRYLFLKSFPP